MAIYRTVHMSFWTDSKVIDEFTAEDRFFYLYLLTNPHTNLCGCYEVSIKQVCMETGLKDEKVTKLIERMEKDLDVIRYDRASKEILLLNWSKHNWTTSEKFMKALVAEIGRVKNKTFREYLTSHASGSDTVSIPYPYGMDTTVAVTDPVTVSNVNTEKESKKTNIYIAERVIAYLNEKTGSKYRLTSSHQSQINARLKEGYSEQDFYTVIDNKVREWKGTEREKYLRPETLFGTKFDSYLNVKQTVPLAAEKPKPKQNAFNSFENQHEYNWDELAKTLSHYPVADTG